MQNEKQRKKSLNRLGRIALTHSELVSTDGMNRLTYANLLDNLKILATSCWQWEGLPESCDARHIEDLLFTYGRCGIVNDPDLGLLSLKIAPNGKYNVYNEPVEWRAFGHGYDKAFNASDVAVIRNNNLSLPTLETAVLYAIRLYEAERTLDNNIKLQKYPVIVRVDEKELMTMKNLMAQYEGNEPFIYGTKSFNLDALDVLNLQVPYIADSIMKYKKDIYNNFLTFFGINNSPSADKKERLIVPEEESNLEAIGLSNWAFRKGRLEGAEEANAKFGLNITVDQKDLLDEKNYFDLLDMKAGEEEKDHGEVYDRA